MRPRTLVIIAMLLGSGVVLGFLWYLCTTVGLPGDDAWVIIPEMTRTTCVMQETRKGVRGRIVLVSPVTPGQCIIAEPGGHPKRLVHGIMLDDATVSGTPAMILEPRRVFVPTDTPSSAPPGHRYATTALPWYDELIFQERACPNDHGCKKP